MDLSSGETAPAATGLKEVPPTRANRERIRQQALERAAAWDKSRPLGKHQLEAHARQLLADLGCPETYVGWTMVVLSAAFWRDQVTTISPQRRLLLLPHCMRHSQQCPAEYNQLGLQCQGCGRCSLVDLQAQAERLGYRVLVAEGSPVVLQLLLSGQADAVLGVACLNSLEKAFDKLLLVGLPGMAVPLLTDSCQDSTADLDWVEELIQTPYRPGPTQTQTYVHLLRCATAMFQPEELDRLVPPQRGSSSAEGNGDGTPLEPLAVTEALAREFLRRGGKYLRPFITLAAYDAMTGGGALGPNGAEHIAQLPDAVKRVALAIEVFHKASLVHDDIEDDDAYRYGQLTLHRTHGAATALNVGDYLVGLGYRLIASQHAALGAETVAELLARLSEAHTRLCEGQGAELAWRAAESKSLAPLDALKIYALKTAPAFEAALYAGLRMAGPAEAYREPAARFSRHLGVAFQILNDLDDWKVFQPNKRSRGLDLLHGRPTVLWALAQEGLDPAGLAELQSLVTGPELDDAVLERIRHLYDQADVYRQAEALVAKHAERARQVADQLPHAELRRLLHYFADTMIPACLPVR